LISRNWLSGCPKRRVGTWELARYTVAIIEGSIMLARTHQDRLLNMRLADDIDQETFARKHTEMRDRLALDQAATRRAGPLAR
jgi:hypothetical protein